MSDGLLLSSGVSPITCVRLLFFSEQAVLTRCDRQQWQKQQANRAHGQLRCAVCRTFTPAVRDSRATKRRRPPAEISGVSAARARFALSLACFRQGHGGVTTGITTWISLRSSARAGRLAAELVRRAKILSRFHCRSIKCSRAGERRAANPGNRRLIRNGQQNANFVLGGNGLVRRQDHAPDDRYLF